MLEVWTARIDYDGPDRLDITRKGADTTRWRQGTVDPGCAFAPSWPIVNDGKKGLERAKRLRDRGQQQRADQLAKDTWWQYRRRYIDEMAHSYRTRNGAWRELLARDRVVLVCYCLKVRECHRWLLGNILNQLGANYRGEVDSEPLFARSRKAG